MSELAQFLLARITEDEEVAQAAGVDPDDQQGWLWILGFDREATEAQDDHIARWDPARVLAECEAKRRIVEDARGDIAWVGTADPNGLDGLILTRAENTLCLLALPYAGHPLYREEWRP